MSNLTDRAAYLRGLAEGMELDTSKSANKLMLEMLKLMDEMAHHIEEMDRDMDELSDYVEDIDSDLSDVEEMLMPDDDDDDDEEEDDDDDEFGEYEDDTEGNPEETDEDSEEDESDEIVFDCPNCGKPVVMKADAIDYEESPVCQFCGQPFFTDIEEDDGEEDVEEEAPQEQQKPVKAEKGKSKH